MSYFPPHPGAHDRRLPRPLRYLCFVVLLALAPGGLLLVMRAGSLMLPVPLLAAVLLTAEILLAERNHPWSLTPRRFMRTAVLLLFGALLMSVFAVGYAVTLF